MTIDGLEKSRFTFGTVLQVKVSNARLRFEMDTADGTVHCIFSQEMTVIDRPDSQPFWRHLSTADDSDFRVLECECASFGLKIDGASVNDVAKLYYDKPLMAYAFRASASSRKSTLLLVTVW